MRSTFRITTTNHRLRNSPVLLRIVRSSLGYEIRGRVHHQEPPGGLCVDRRSAEIRPGYCRYFESGRRRNSLSSEFFPRRSSKPDREHRLRLADMRAQPRTVFWLALIVRSYWPGGESSGIAFGRAAFPSDMAGQS